VNYRGLSENYINPMQLIMSPATEAKDWFTCFHVCEWLLAADGPLSKEDRRSILTHFARATFELGGEYVDRAKKSGALEAFFAA